jgi:hypothetical protein
MPIVKGGRGNYGEGAFVCEGTNFSSWGYAIQAATGRPFFDIVTMTRWVYAAVVRRGTTGGFM